MANNNPLKRRPSERRPIQIEKARRKAEERARDLAERRGAREARDDREPTA
ncbi:hypothetical protein TA3x_003829 [Tundrisphaera sp. TA3]|uniref:hypothetical protein n=1 Tax=Tundrisphaera sp. TA3 TaxID=3435775 RepID=UPI003EBDCD6B